MTRILWRANHPVAPTKKLLIYLEAKQQLFNISQKVLQKIISSKIKSNVAMTVQKKVVTFG